MHQCVRLSVDVSSSMEVSWRNRTLYFLCLFLCTIHLTKAGCDDYFKSISAFAHHMTLTNLTQMITLLDAPTFKEIMVCTLEKEINNSRPHLRHLLRHCNEDNVNKTCGPQLREPVSFLDFMCLIATAFNKTMDVCSHDVANKLLLRFGTITATTTTTTTTTSPMPMSTCPPTVSPSTPSPPQKTSGSLSPLAPNKQAHENITNKVVTDNIAYTMLGLSLIINVLLAFFVTTFCWRRHSHGTSSSEQNDLSQTTQTNGHLLEDSQLIEMNRQIRNSIT